MIKRDQIWLNMIKNLIKKLTWKSMELGSLRRYLQDWDLGLVILLKL